MFYNEDDTVLDHKFVKTFRNNWIRFDGQAKVWYLPSTYRDMVDCVGD